MNHKPRRTFFKQLGLSLAAVSVPFNGLASLVTGKQRHVRPVAFSEAAFEDDFAQTNNRIWLGEKYWAVPMEDWQVKDGRLECNSNLINARVNVLTTVIQAGAGDFNISATIGLISATGGATTGSAGFSVGVRDEIDPDVKAACYYGKGLPVGISTTKSALFIAEQTTPLPANFNYTHFTLTVTASQTSNGSQLKATCVDKEGLTVSVSYQNQAAVSGLVALVNNFEEKGGGAFWFRNFKVSGSKISNQPGNSFGPILWAMHTLSRGTLRVVAQMPPLGEKDAQTVELQLKKGGAWTKAATATIDPLARTAHFQLQNWDAGKAVSYQLVYKNQGQTYTYNGTIRQEPLARTLRFGGLTCQEYGGYPYGPLVKNLKKHDPDMLYFSGDQLYEGNGGYPIKRQPEQASVLSYLGKWYMFGWAFGDLMRDRPTVCTPDDHDVFQGNLWGEGGQGVPFAEWEQVRDAHGGYVQTPAMVNVVGKTQCGHLPAPFHNQALPSGIETWYTDLVYGKVSFAIISDRMFKSGPDSVRTGTGRIDHLKEPVPENQLERPDLSLLGQGQMDFLTHWIQDWQGAHQKVLLSQTLFCNVGTHHGPEKMFLHGDMDSGGWPKQQRDAALRIIRKACALHINGDQHLPFLVQYTLDEPRDGSWTFCTPAISTGYIRWGQPDAVQSPHTNRPAHGLPNTGLYQDGFGNTNYIYAVGNPEDTFQNKNRYLRAQSKASGFGLITFDTEARTIKMEAYRFLADKDKPTADDQFPGWPFTISQTDNDGRKPVAYLPKLVINKPDQVVTIKQEPNGDIARVLRIKGTTYQPGVFQEGSYTVMVGEGKNRKEWTGIKAEKAGNQQTIRVQV